MELRRGEEVPEEWAWPGGGRANDGNLSRLIYTLVRESWLACCKGGELQYNSVWVQSAGKRRERKQVVNREVKLYTRERDRGKIPMVVIGRKKR